MFQGPISKLVNEKDGTDNQIWDRTGDWCGEEDKLFQTKTIIFSINFLQSLVICGSLLLVDKILAMPRTI